MTISNIIKDSQLLDKPMYLAIKFWKDMADKPSDMPDYWPAEVKELGSSTKLPLGKWSLMTCDDLIRYKAARQEVYDLWQARNKSVPIYVDPDAPEEE